MTLEQAVEEASRRGLGPGWVAQDGCADSRLPYAWFFAAWPNRPWAREYSVEWTAYGATAFLGTGAPNPDGWRTTLTEVK